MTVLSRENAAPLQHQIAALLRAEISDGRYEPSGRLPSEAALCLRFGVSLVTVRLALALARLSEEGAIAATLGLSPGSALLVMERSSYFPGDRCCDYSLFYIRQERYAFVISTAFGSRT